MSQQLRRLLWWWWILCGMGMQNHVAIALVEFAHWRPRLNGVIDDASDMNAGRVTHGGKRHWPLRRGRLLNLGPEFGTLHQTVVPIQFGASRRRSRRRRRRRRSGYFGRHISAIPVLLQRAWCFLFEVCHFVDSHSEQRHNDMGIQYPRSNASRPSLFQSRYLVGVAPVSNDLWKHRHDTQKAHVPQ
jgi:hypothetical protein